MRRRAACTFLRFGIDREFGEELHAEFMMEPLVGLDHLAIQPRGLFVAGLLAQLDELRVLDQRDRLAGELPGSDPLDVGFESAQKLEERAVSGGERIKSREIVAQPVQALLDEPVVPGFVAGLTRERELEGDAARRRHP